MPPNDNAAMPAVATSAQDLTPAGFGSMAAFKLLYRAGEMLASTALVPDVYRDKPADCALIVEIAQRINASPLMVANSLDIIHGRPSWRAAFLIACVNRCGRFSALRYEWRGDEGTKERACRAWAKELSNGDRLDGVWITWKMVEAEGWSKKTGSKWMTMPDQMFQYRAASFWSRAYAPDITLGFPTDDEVRDVIDITPTDTGASPIDAAKDRIRAAMAPTGHTAERVDYDKAKEPPPTDLAGGFTYAQVRDALEKSKTGSDERTLARDMIRGVADEGQRGELIKLADLLDEKV